MSNKETLKNYNTRLLTNNSSLSEILNTINNLPKDNTNKDNGCLPNLFIQEGEPDTFEGIWIQISEQDNAPVIIEDNIEQVSSALDWTNTTLPTIPNTFSNGRCVSIGTNIFLFGGGGSSSGSSSRYTAYKYDTLTKTYTQLTNIPYSFYDGVIGVSGNDIYLFGGIYNETKAYKYDTITDTYTQLASLPFGSVNGYSASVGTDIYLFASYNAPQVVYKYDTINDTYTQMTNTPTATAYGKATAIGTDIYIFGSNNTNYQQVAYKYDTLSDTYTRITNIPFRFFNGACVANNKFIYILGSEVTGIKKYAYKYDPLNDEYTQVTFLPHDFWNGDAAMVDNDIYLLGGAGSSTTMIMSKTVQLTINTDLTDGIVIYSPTQGKLLYTTELFSSEDLINRALFGFNAVLLMVSGSLELLSNVYYGTGTAWVKCDEMYIEPIIEDINLQSKKITITENGTIDVYADDGFDALHKVTVETDVSAALLQNKSVNIYSNGTTVISADDGFDGIGTATVSVLVSQEGGGYIENCSELLNANSGASNSLVNRIIPACRPTTTYKMFYQNNKITGVLDCTLMDMSQCTTCESMFESLPSVSSINVSNFNTSACTNMQSMFIYFGSSNTDAIKLDLSSFDTTNVTNMSYMFYNTMFLQELDLSSFDFTNVKSFGSMFTNCGANSATGTTIVYVKDEVAQNWILTKSNSRPSSWSTANVIIKNAE